MVNDPICVTVRLGIWVVVSSMLCVVVSPAISPTDSAAIAVVVSVVISVIESIAIDKALAKLLGYDRGKGVCFSGTPAVPIGATLARTALP